MKKLVRLLSIVSIAATAGLWSCKGEPGEVGPQGSTGPQGTAGNNGTNGTNGKDGTNGTNGTNGNANVESFIYKTTPADWRTIEISGIGNGATSKWGVATVANAKVSTDKFVMIFLKANGGLLKALPLLYNKDLDSAVERLDYAYKTGEVQIYYRQQSQLFGPSGIQYAPNGDIEFEVVLTAKSIGAGMRRAGVDLNDYNAVMKYLGRI